MCYIPLVSDTPTATAPDLSPSQIQRLVDLRRQLRMIQIQIREIGGEAALVTRSPIQCLRCGYEWYPYNQYLPPICCAQCGTTAWNIPPTATSRKPGDPPPPGGWRIRKGTKRKPRYRVYVPRMPEEKGPAPISATPPPWVKPIMNVVLSDFPPPPVVESVILPPPPAPSYVRFNDAKPEEPQPEMVTSHAGPLVEMPDGELHLRDEVSVVNIGAPIEDIPPEQIGIPATDAEREELAKSQEEAWPTTREE